MCLIPFIKASRQKLCYCHVSISIGLYTFIIIFNQVTDVTLIENANVLVTSDTNALQTQVMFYLEQYSQGIMVAQIFWGLWLFPFGYLVYQSNFLPKLFGVFLMLGCVGYVLTFLGDFLITDLVIRYFRPSLGFLPPYVN